MVAGENRGRIVYIEYEGSYFFFPEEQNFLCWYQRWLYEICNKYNIYWFATNIDGVIKYYKQSKTETEKLRIIHSFDKFPVFSQSTIDFLKTVMLESINIENTKEFLLLIYRIDIDFFLLFFRKTMAVRAL